MDEGWQFAKRCLEEIVPARTWCYVEIDPALTDCQIHFVPSFFIDTARYPEILSLDGAFNASLTSL